MTRPFFRAAVFILTLAAIAVAAPATAAPAKAPSAAKVKTSKVANSVEQLADDVAKAKAAGRSASRLSNPLLRTTAGGEIELTFHALGPLRGRERHDLTQLGARIVAAVSLPAKPGLPGAGLIQAWVPYDRVADAAALSWVAAVTPPDYGNVDDHPTNPTNSQGVALHNADDVQNRGINGAGVNVGVISDGVSNLAAAANELPNVNVLDTGSGDEGTAMLEIVHDMAPGAGLLFDASGGGVTAHIASLNNLVANGANVITEDIAFDGQPAFQIGEAAQAALNVAAAGVSVHSSAGNQALRHTARVTANGTGNTPDGTAFASTPPTGCTNTPDNVVAIAPGGDTTFDVTLGNGGGSFTLQWSEPRAIAPTAGQGGFTDLNLYVMNAALTQCLFESVGGQGFGVGDTMEQIGFGTGMGGTNVKVVVDVQGTSNALAAPILDLRGRGFGAIDGTTRAGSLNPDSNYIGQATSSAALDAQNAGAIEPYSSGGPVQIITTTRCSGLAPCVGIAPFGSPVAGANQTAGGPTWAAADNVAVSGVGGFGSPFTGTSAAAPHAAACDALLRDEINNAAAAPATTNARLITTAVDIAPAGVDNVTGAGRLDCLLAINDPPSANAGGPYSTPEGTDVTLNGTGSTDPDTGDTLSYSWDLNNDGIFGDSTAASPTFSLVGQDGVFTVRLRVTDTANATDTATTTVTVTNVAPSVNATANDPKPEGSPVTVTGTVSDPGWLENLTATIDWGDGSPVQTITGTLENDRQDATLTFSVTHTYLDDNAADLYTAIIRGSDDDATTPFSLPIVIFNVPPTVGPITVPGGAAQINTPVNVSGSFTDPGVLDTHTAVWDWADGTTTPGTVTQGAGSGSVTDAHSYASADLYAITLTVTDDDGGVDSSTSDFVPVFDPTRSLAANAKIDSPANAYVPNPSKTGLAYSTAGARYKNQMAIPSGATTFQFSAVPFYFSSGSLDWLVVANGGRGYLRGTGSVNGVPGYSFLLSVVDAQAPGGPGGVDKYRIKVWNTATSAVVYDSQFGAAINAPANIPLLAGSVQLFY